MMKKETNFFSEIMEIINNFAPKEPLTNERMMEIKLKECLKNAGIEVESQITKRRDRYDLICKRDDKKICIELKIKTHIGNVSQFDRYLKKFKDGFIVVCWQATSSIKEIFDATKNTSPIPIALIELHKRYSI